MFTFLNNYFQNTIMFDVKYKTYILLKFIVNHARLKVQRYN
jgi:hypothetical protein